MEFSISFLKILTRSPAAIYLILKNPSIVQGKKNSVFLRSMAFFRICLEYLDTNSKKIKLFNGNPFGSTYGLINLRTSKPLLVLGLCKYKRIYHEPFQKTLYLGISLSEYCKQSISCFRRIPSIIESSFFIFSAIKKSFLPILVFFLCAAIAKHPYHVGVTEITLNSSSQTLQVRCKLITNDVQEALIAQQKTSIDLSLKSQDNKVLLGNFMLSGLQLQLSKQPIAKQTQIRLQSPINLIFLGWEIEEDAIWCYFEANNTPPQKNISVCNTLLFGQFSGQTHFVHCVFNGTRKSHKLSNPEGCTSFQF